MYRYTVNCEQQTYAGPYPAHVLRGAEARHDADAQSLRAVILEG